jgi:hypothetical protein
MKRNGVVNIFTSQIEIEGEHFCKNSIEEVPSLSFIHHFFCAKVKKCGATHIYHFPSFSTVSPSLINWEAPSLIST